MLDRLLDHKADEHFFEEVHAPIFYLCIELLMRNIEKVSQLLGVVEPEKGRKSSRHEHLERDEIALAKLVMKEGEKPGKFLLPHGIILLKFGPYRIFMEGNPEGIQNQRPLGIMELSVDRFDFSGASGLIKHNPIDDAYASAICWLKVSNNCE
jgi:hypothetical protein